VALDNAFLNFQHDGGLPNGVSNFSIQPMVLATASLNPPPSVIISGTTTATVKSGSTTTYSLVVTPRFGFSGALALGCQDLPRFSTCSVSPSSVTLQGSPVNFTVTVNTTTLAASNSAPSAGAAGMVFAFVFAPFALIIVAGSRKKLLPVLFAGILVLLMASCGGGNNPGTVQPPPPPGTTPPGIYNPTATATTSSNVQTQYALTMIVQ
jgi:hypothetical protein